LIEGKKTDSHRLHERGKKALSTIQQKKRKKEIVLLRPGKKKKKKKDPAIGNAPEKGPAPARRIINLGEKKGGRIRRAGKWLVRRSGEGKDSSAEKNQKKKDPPCRKGELLGEKSLIE